MNPSVFDDQIPSQHAEPSQPATSTHQQDSKWTKIATQLQQDIGQVSPRRPPNAATYLTTTGQPYNRGFNNDNLRHGNDDLDVVDYDNNDDDDDDRVDFFDVMEKAEPHWEGSVGWKLMAAVMVSEVLGAGLLSLPYAYVRLGWIPGILITVAIFLLSTLTGLQIFRQKVAFPIVNSFPKLFRTVLSKPWQIYSSICVYILMGMYFTSQLIVQIDSWIAIFPSLPQASAMALAVITTWALCQARTMNNIGLLSVFGVFTIIVPTIITLISLATIVGTEDYPRGQTSLFGSSFVEAMMAVMSIVFAFAGHLVFFELMNEFSVLQDFPKSLWASQTLVMIVNIALPCIAYAICGDAAWLQSPFTISLPQGPTRDVVQAFVLIHLATVMTINVTILSRAVQDYFEPLVKVLHRRIRRLRARAGHGPPVSGIRRDPPKVASPYEWNLPAVLWWLIWTGIALWVAGLVAVVIPSFDNMVSFASSLIASQTNYLWPAVFDWIIFHRSRQGLLAGLWLSIDIFLIVVGVFFLICGLWSNIIDISGYYLIQDKG